MAELSVEGVFSSFNSSNWVRIHAVNPWQEMNIVISRVLILPKTVGIHGLVLLISLQVMQGLFKHKSKTNFKFNYA